MAEQAPKVSVILPVYNVEPYIGHCIESLKSQTLSELEFIFVNDCSTDASMEAVEAWAAEDDRVRILYNEENLGSGPTRNRGIEVARGDYLSFVDPDDYLASDFYQLLYDAAQNHGFPDIVKGRRLAVPEGSPEPLKVAHPALNDRIRHDQRTGLPLWYSFSFEHQAAIYLRSAVLQSGARYGTSRVSQDITFLLRFCSAGAPGIVLEDAASYFYAVRAGSAVRSTSPEKLEHRLHAFEEQVDCLVELAKSDPQTGLRYVSRSIEYPLAPMGLNTGRISGDEPAVHRFFEGLRQQLLRLPGTEDASSRDLVVQALAEYGRALAQGPYAPSGELPHAADWPPVLAEWLRFCGEASHSRLLSQLKAASRVRTALFELTRRRGLVGDDADFNQALASTRQLLKEVGPRARLVRLDPQLAIFAAGGPALVFGMKRRVKRFAWLVLGGARSAFSRLRR